MVDPPAPATPAPAPTGETPMSLAEARAVVWQGRASEPRAPMGRMLDAGQLTARDLRWAAERHFNPRVQTAARVLLETPRLGNVRTPRCACSRRTSTAGSAARCRSAEHRRGSQAALRGSRGTRR